MRKTNFLEKILFFLIFALFVGNMIVHIKSLKLSAEIKRVEDSLLSLEEEVGLLQERLLKEDNLSTISSKAAQLGFKEIDNVLQINIFNLALKEE